MYLPLRKVADTPFHVQWDDVISQNEIVFCTHLFKILRINKYKIHYFLHAARTKIAWTHLAPAANGNRLAGGETPAHTKTSRQSILLCHCLSEYRSVFISMIIGRGNRHPRNPLTFSDGAILLLILPG